ncbi:MAG: hypothetical protein PGN34_11900 [Methylobacterium frigidaeris]
MNALKAWIQGGLSAARADIVAGRQNVILRRHLPLAFAAGLATGCVLSVLAAPAALLVLLVTGGAVGYAARSFISWRRRQRYIARQWEQGR